MKAIHLANAEKRDAQVAVEQFVHRTRLRTVLPSGEDKVNARLLKNTVKTAYDVILAQYDGNNDELEQALIEGDPEVEIEAAGRQLKRTHKLYITQDHTVAYRLNLYQVVYGPGGSEIERHDINKLPANINAEIPIKWTGRKYSKSDAIRKFVFSRKYQLRHINGVTFDFLHRMAAQLQADKAIVLVGAGKKGNEPILLTRGGQPYRGFLEGRAAKDRYALILHLSDIELKPIEP